ncbi:MAG: hypothetical protein WCD49_16610 [Candidatus Acidiferrales bacterium]
MRASIASSFFATAGGICSSLACPLAEADWLGEVPELRWLSTRFCAKVLVGARKAKTAMTTRLQAVRTVERNIGMFIFKSTPFWSMPDSALRTLFVLIKSIFYDPRNVDATLGFVLNLELPISAKSAAN